MTSAATPATVVISAATPATVDTLFVGEIWPATVPMFVRLVVLATVLTSVILVAVVFMLPMFAATIEKLLLITDMVLPIALPWTVQ